MNIIIGNKVKYKRPENTYVLSIETDGKFGTHNIKLSFENNDNDILVLRDYIILLEKISKEYLEGKPSNKGYNHIDNFDILSDKWFVYDNMIDYLRSYNIRYYNDNSECYRVDITNDNEMINEILK
jgi:hypothetical protein